MLRSPAMEETYWMLLCVSLEFYHDTNNNYVLVDDRRAMQNCNLKGNLKDCMPNGSINNPIDEAQLKQHTIF